VRGKSISTISGSSKKAEFANLDIPRQAFVLGAGIGQRLRPLTERRPKPLVPVFNKPLITFAFDHLRSLGVPRSFVNTHHCAGAYQDLLGGLEYSYDSMLVRFVHEEILLDTGGGIRNASSFLQRQPFFVYNGDILTDVPLEPLVREHFDKNNLVTLLLRSTGGPLQVQFDPDSGRVQDIRKSIGGSNAPAFLYSGIALYSPEVFGLLPSDSVFSIVPVWLDWIRSGFPVGAVIEDSGLWMDLGNRESYLAAHQALARASFQLAYSMFMPMQRIAASALVSPDAFVDSWSSVGASTCISAGADIRESILWEGVEISSATRLDRCIVRDGMNVSGLHQSVDL